LRAEIQEGLAREEELSQLHLRSQEELEALETKLEDMESMEKTLKEKLDTATDSISKREKQLSETEERCTGLQKLVDDITAKYDDLRSLLESEKVILVALAKT